MARWPMPSDEIAVGSFARSRLRAGMAALAALLVWRQLPMTPVGKILRRELRDKLTELLGTNNVRLLYAPTRELN